MPGLKERKVGGRERERDIADRRQTDRQREYICFEYIYSRPIVNIVHHYSILHSNQAVLT